MASDKAASWYFASRSVVYSSIIARGSVGWILCLCVFPPAMNLSKSGILSYFCLLVLSWMCSIHIYIMDESVHGVHSPDAAASGWRNTIIAPMDNRKRPPLKVFLNHYLCQRKHWGFPFRNSSQSHWASVVVQLVKNLPANAGDTRDVGSLPGGGNGNPLQYSCLENSIDEPGGLQSVGSQRVEHDWVNMHLYYILGFLRWVKNLLANAGDAGVTDSIPGSGRCPGEGHGNPLWSSCLENPLDRGAWRATVHRVEKSWTRLKWLSMHAACPKSWTF